MNSPELLKTEEAKDERVSRSVVSSGSRCAPMTHSCVGCAVTDSPTPLDGAIVGFLLRVIDQFEGTVSDPVSLAERPGRSASASKTAGATAKGRVPTTPVFLAGGISSRR